MFRPRSVLLAACAGVAITIRLAIAADAKGGEIAVGPQYGSTHVYVEPEQVDRFVASIVATFGGHASPAAVITATPVPSVSVSRIVSTPAGLFSVFGFRTPVPYPFGEERTGYLVTDMESAVAAARRAGAEAVVAPFADAIGRDAIIRWPGGVMMQLYWHTKAPSYPPLRSLPENRVYVSGDAADVFIRGFLAFSEGRVTADDRRSPGADIGRPGDIYRCVHIASAFGNMAVSVTDGHLPWPYGREVTGYAVADLAQTLGKAKAAGAEILVGPYRNGDRDAAMIRFPGGYIAEVHAAHHSD